MGMRDDDVYHTVVIAPATSNTVAKCASGISDSLPTNMFAQAGKLGIPGIVFACDTQALVVTKSPHDWVTLRPRRIEFENVERLRGIDFCRPFRNFGKDGHGIVFQFHETAGNVKLLRRCPLREGEHAGLQLRDQRGVAGQYSQLAAEPGNVNRIDALGHYAPLGSYYLQLKFICHNNRVTQTVSLRSNQKLTLRWEKEDAN